MAQRVPTPCAGTFKQVPPLDTTGLRDCQIDAIRGLEASLAKDQPRALIQMATRAGKDLHSLHLQLEASQVRRGFAEYQYISLMDHATIAERYN